MRLLLLAYRRGLLREGYPQGLASRARELILMDMLEMEERAETIKQSIDVRTTMLGPNVDLKQYHSAVNNLLERLDAASAYREYALFYAQEQELQRDLEAKTLWENLKKLEEAGIIEQFRKMSLAKYEEVQERYRARRST